MPLTAAKPSDLTAAGPRHGLAFASLAQSVQWYFQEGLAPSTRRSYDAGMKKFYKFCTAYQITDPFPGTESILCYFAAYMANEGLSAQTGKSYMAAVRNMELSLGLPDPREQLLLPVLKRIQAGIKRLRLNSGKTRLPITTHVLRQQKGVLGSTAHPEGTLLWAVSCTEFLGFFRLGELLTTDSTFNACSLGVGGHRRRQHSIPNNGADPPEKSKIDQFGSGADVILGTTGMDLCPVAAMLAYVVSQGSSPGPFFRLSNGNCLTKPERHCGSWASQLSNMPVTALGLGQPHRQLLPTRQFSCWGDGITQPFSAI